MRRVRHTLSSNATRGVVKQYTSTTYYRKNSSESINPLLRNGTLSVSWAWRFRIRRRTTHPLTWNFGSNLAKNRLKNSASESPSRQTNMAHPSDMLPNGTCQVCSDRLSPVIRKRKGKLAFRRHLSKPDCETKGEGEPITQTQRAQSGD